MPKPKRIFDFEEVERVARETTTVVEFCRRLKIQPTSMSTFKATNPEFAAAFERGRPPKEKKLLERNRLAELAPEDFYSCGLQNLPVEEIAAANGTSAVAVSEHFSRFPECRTAYEKGKRGIALADESSVSADPRKTAVTDETGLTTGAESRNFKPGELNARIFEIAAGGATCFEIAGKTGEDARVIYNCLSKMVTGGKLEKYIDAENVARYRLPLKPEKKQPKPTAAKPGERERIKRAVGEGSNLSRSICMATGIPGGVVIEELEQMVYEDEIVARREVGFIAYFLPDDAPKEADKLILNGKGGVSVIKPPEPEKKTKRAPAPQAKWNGAFSPQTVAAPLMPPPAALPKPKPSGQKRNTVQKGIVYSEEMFERYGLEKLNKSQIGRRLGVGITAISYQLAKPHFKEAYERGLKGTLVQDDGGED